MTNTRRFILFTIIVFAGIVAISFFKKNQNDPVGARMIPKPHTQAKEEESVLPQKKEEKKIESSTEKNGEEKFEARADRIRGFFSKGVDKFPIVETITYTSRVPWLKGRPAWIADYASYYETSRHFIARSLNGARDYETQRVSPGDKFNVLKKEINIEFYLLVDLSTCTMDFYYLDKDLDERVFVKTYNVGVGREDPLSPSGNLTPVGKYLLGEKVAIYKPGVEHYYQNQKTHMIEVFGTRWMPFGREIENCSDSAKGYGFHGVPCTYDNENQLLIEKNDGVGTKNSDGCIRLAKEDIEELFSIVITKPTIVEIVKNRADAVLPMSVENKLE